MSVSTPPPIDPVSKLRIRERTLVGVVRRLLDDNSRDGGGQWLGGVLVVDLDKIIDESDTEASVRDDEIQKSRRLKP